MIPSSVLSFDSAAEKRVFAMLQQVNLGPNDVVLHSLNLGKHKYKRWGEIDFLVISREGILVIEVKGGRVACRNGIWEFTNKDNKTSRKKESPASQARSAFFSLHDNYLKPRFRRELDSVVKGWGVLFEGIDRVVSIGNSQLPEQPDAITGYRSDCSGHNSLKAFLQRLFGYWAEHVRGTSQQLNDKLIEEIVTTLRPNFEQLPPLNSQLAEFSDELCDLSDEQSRRLDELEENDRMMIFGGAGTGKTFLAMATARYDAADGRSVLIVTRSRFLAEFLNAHPHSGNIVACCLDDLKELQASNDPWDTLIVDEGQDMCQMSTLDILETCVSGGLEKGRWRWFGDPNNQISTQYEFDPDALAFLRGLSFVRRLSDNIRNAPPIVESLVAVAEVDIGTPRSRGLGSQVKVKRVRCVDEIPGQAAKVVGKWVAGPDSVPRSDVVVLTPRVEQVDGLVAALKAAGVRAETLSRRALSGKKRDCVLVSTISEFKGLERPVVCVAGIGEPSDVQGFQRSAYAGFSRANHTLSVVCTYEEADLLTKLEIERTKKEHA
nr:NERD domain-containing protein [Ruegeria arenilitoris]